jgi:hypothetical protein
LADLKAKRDQIDQAIAAIEALRGPSTIPGAQKNGSATSADGPSAFLGMTIPEGAKKLLAARRQPMRNPDIAAAFKVGGLVLNSADPVNTVGAVLSRRANDIGDIVKVGRGTWGLKEWYPGRSFKKKVEQDKEEEEDEAEEAAPDAGIIRIDPSAKA